MGDIDIASIAAEAIEHGGKNLETIILKLLSEHQKMIESIQEALSAQIAVAAKSCIEALRQEKKLLFCGNGGSAADCQHLAAEFVGRFQTERRGLPAVALTTDTSILTAVGNDYGFEKIFARQVEALGQPGDVLVGLSTSGNSQNVLLAVQQAKEIGLKTIALTGRDGGKLRTLSDICLNVPVSNTARVQEGHILIGHILCELLDDVENGK